MRKYIERVMNSKNLTAFEMKEASERMFHEQTDAEDIKSFLIALHEKGETAVEMASLIQVLQADLNLKTNGAHYFDNCGTGGDGSNSFNISTTASFTLAAAGIKVAKNGNRKVTSSSGSTDLLEELQIPTTIPQARFEDELHEKGLVFIFAPAIYPKLKQMSAIRKSIPTPTIFNLIGPLSNPLQLTYQLTGINNPALLHEYAKALHLLGRERAVVLSGEGGMDEASLHGTTQCILLDHGELIPFSITANEVGLRESSLADITGGTPAENAEIFHSIMDGIDSPYQDAVVFNAGIALFIANEVETIQQGVKKAREIIQSGKAKEMYEKMKMTVLQKIIETKKTEVAELLKLDKPMDQQLPIYSLADQLSNSEQLRIIAEFKRASPSKGMINDQLSPIDTALQYEIAGAAAISVLTDRTYFKGSFQDLYQVATHVKVPVLCKDFIIDEVQIDYARIHGASVILLIVAALSKERISELYQYAKYKGMEVLVEVHDERELQIATSLGAKIIGINNRNLHTFEVDLNHSKTLMKNAKVDSDVFFISESGIQNTEDAQTVSDAGATAILVGETLMTAENIHKAFNELSVEKREVTYDKS